MYDILKYIWAHARSGSDVRELVIKRSAGVPDGLRGIYFASGGRRLLVLLNRGHHASSLSLDVPFAEGIMTNSSAGGALNIRAFGMGDRLMMEPMSVAVLIGKEPITLNSE